MELVFDIQLVSCLAHIRRKFVDATGNHPQKAGVALGMIEQLYELERTYKSEGLTPTQRKERRMMEAKPKVLSLLLSREAISVPGRKPTLQGALLPETSVAVQI
jgi:hypothetical protein